MLDIQQKRKLRSVMYHKVTLGVLAVLTLFMIHSTWEVNKKKVSSQEMRKLAEERVNDLNRRKNDLNNKIDQLGTVSGIEEEIRSKFSVAKDGEKMVVVVEQNKKTATSTNKETSFWRKFVQFLRL
ncbi:MAG: hypothetical protein WAX44_03120 [Minisyncoccia bacterium]